MTSYVGRTVFLADVNSYGEVVSETWENGPMLEIILKNGKKVWRPDYEIVVM